MTKTERTRNLIIRESAQIINRKGMAGTSIGDIMAATGLSKGGIYGNFKDKNEICAEAYKYLADSLTERGQAVISKGKTAIEKFHYLLDSYSAGTYINGGCPMLNIGVETDDSENLMRELVKRTIKKCQETIERILAEGIKNGEFCGDLNVGDFSRMAFALIEGATFCTRVLGDKEPMAASIGYLKAEIERYCIDAKL